ncbi:MAG: glycosyltransferase [Chloroflexota bacterium]
MSRLLRAPLRIGRRLARRGRGWLSRRGWARTARSLLNEAPLVLRDPGLVVALGRAEARGDPVALAPLLDRALAGRRSRYLLRRQAELLGTIGELSRSRDAWRELARSGDAAAARKVRWIEGRLTELDTQWLPRIPEGREPLVAASRDRILHIAKSAAPERWSGFTIRTLQNLRAQRSAGLEPIIVTKLGWPREAGLTEVPAQVTFEGFEQHYLDRGPDYDPSSLPFDVRLQDTTDALVPLVRELRPAVLHVHSGHRGGELVLAALALRGHFDIPVVYEVRGLFEATWTSDMRIAERAEVYQRRLAQETRILRDVDGVVAISEALAAELVARGIPRTKITVVPNGIDPDALQPAPRDAALRARLGLDDRLVVGYLGNLDHWREGIDVLLAALAQLHARGRTDIAVLVVGDGTRRPSMEEEARRLGLTSSVRFTGRVPHAEVGRYYGQMDVFTNPRVDERASRLITPLKPYEAMALGIPVLVSDLPALREIVDPPNRGAIAPPGDARGLADGLERLLDDPAERARLGEAGRAWVLAERRWSANGPRYRAAYEAILGPID